MGLHFLSHNQCVLDCSLLDYSVSDLRVHDCSVYGYIICIVRDKMLYTLDVQDSSGNFCGLYDISVWDCSVLDYSQCGAVFTPAVYLTTV